jgi:hypothetical protein
MVILIAATAIVLTAGLFFLSAKRFNSTGLRYKHSTMVALGVQIICGDCAGDGETPRKTYLDQTGRCCVCGGQSFVLASTAALNSLRAVARIVGYESSDSSRRVLPFESPNSRGRSEKIA